MHQLLGLWLDKAEKAAQKAADKTLRLRECQKIIQLVKVLHFPAPFWLISEFNSLIIKPNLIYLNKNKS